MRKEVILAIIIGVIFGGVGLYGLKLANQTVVSQKIEEPESITPTISTTPTPSITDTINIDSPTDHSVSFNSTINIKGRTRPNSPVAITVENSDEIVQSDTQGIFSLDVTLVGGENNITVSVPQQNGEVMTKTISVIYTSTTIDN